MRFHLSCCAIAALSACAEAGSRAGANADDVPLFVLEEELRIGSVDDPDVGFSRIRGVEVNGDGLIHVLEGQELRVRVYDDSGRIVRVLGGQGEGPGEFQSAYRFGFIGDTAWVYDLGLSRITLFGPEGDFLRTIRTPRTSIEAAAGISITLYGSSLRADGTVGSDWGYGALSGGPEDTLAVPHVRFDTTGAILDTIRMQRWSFPTPVTVDGQTIVAPTLPSTFELQVEAGLEYFAVTRSIAANADDARFSVARIGARGDTIFHRAYSYEPVPFPETWLDSLVGRRVESLARSGRYTRTALESAFRAVIALPAYQPPIYNGRAGADTVLWLQREDDDRNVRQWLRIGPDGELLGAVEVPNGVTIRWSRGDIVWAVVPDDLDVPWLVRYRIRPAAR